MSSYERIAELAYRLWNERGRPHGSAESDWLEAERQLASTAPAERDRQVPSSTVDATLEATFPASDPAASHTPDVPPSNADAKWKAAGKTRKNSSAAGTKVAKAPKSTKTARSTDTSKSSDDAKGAGP